YVQIDSRNDGKSAFFFAVNISGVLADAQIIDQTTISWEWDENWDAKTSRTSRGWTAEIRIPLRVLRFDSKLPVQSWGLQMNRSIAQREETDVWAYVPRDVPAQIPFFGRLDGLQGLKGAGALELQPFALGYGRRRDANQMTSGKGYDGNWSAGLNLKWHILQDLTFDAAFNPDFSQVELDQVILNLSTYETFLPEKRPFFLEGIDAFSFPMQVFYSRRIGSAPVPPSLRSNVMTGPNGQSVSEQLVDVPVPATIYAAGKLVGRLSPNWTIGALSAVTGANDVQVLEGNTTAPRLVAPVTAFNVLRLKRELGSGGHVGLIGTGVSTFEDSTKYPPVSTAMPNVQMCPSGVQPVLGRCFHDGYLGGLDVLWRSKSSTYVINGSFIESYIHGGPDVQQYDGTVIKSGATAPGGWLRLAKEGGKHLLLSLEYTGAGRKLQYNDMGYMQRQNVQTVQASVGWRTLKPTRFTVDTTTSLVASDSRNLSGLDLGQTYELNTRLRLLDFSSIFLAASFAPARFDDREVGDGTALQRAQYWGGKIEYDSDPRRSIFATIADQTQIMGAGIYATNIQGSLVFHALPQLDIELLPQVTWAAGEYRYAWQAVTADADPYWFGKLAARNVSATLRATYTFTPRLSLQAYAQAYLASGHFSDLRGLGLGTSPAGTVMRIPGQKVYLSDLKAAPAPVAGPTDNPDFEEAAINANVVLRWEYRLGSTLYLVYTRSQIPALDPNTFAPPATLSPRNFGHGATTDVVLLKLSYWWGS
ncbi:MAG: DUF5916 domain-containing protein, partial [Pseudomonadota bacterium]